jgi:DnaD/phage-associated family protein
MERPFKGIWIPAEIWLDEKLTVMEKVLYAEIDSFCSKGRECFCSNAHFAKVLQVSERQVIRLINSLEEKGVISRRLVYKGDSKEVDKRYLKAIRPAPFDTTPTDIDVTTPTDKTVTTPGEENVTDTNTVFTNPIITKEEEEADWQAVLKAYQDNVRPALGPMDFEMLASLHKDFSKEWVLAGIEECVKSNARNIRYLSSVLERWKVDGFKVDNRHKKETLPADNAPSDGRPPDFPAHWVKTGSGWCEPYID